MRVLHWYPKYGGGGGVANAVLGLATAQKLRGAEVAVATMPACANQLYGPLGDGPRQLIWRPSSNLLRVFWPHVRAADRIAIDEFAPDVIHVHGEFNPDNLAAAAVFSGPLVLSPHGGFNPHVFARGRKRIKRLYFALARRALYRRAVLHAISPLEALDIERLLPGRPVYCVQQGPGMAGGTPPGASPLPPNDGRLRLLFVGRLNLREKGLDLMVEALALAQRQSARRLELVLCGPDWVGSRVWLEQRLAELGCRDRVVFTGCLQPAAVAALYRDCDCYIQLSRLEGFGLSVAEALLAGMPAILSDQIGAAAFPEIGEQPHVAVVPCA
ncbi:MAG: glycosyltransferase, partial [Planctomycetes bacterium]|nr:glycosyltransferase [Planctomycetota bacterium]